MSSIARKSREKYWREQIEAQIRSGKAIQKFCNDQGINHHTFGYWKQKLQVVKPASQFISLSSQRFAPSRSPRIHLPNGVQIDVGAGLESEAVSSFLRSLCGVNHAKS